jgi:uncharacterized protein
MRLPIEQIDEEGRELTLEVGAGEFPVLEDLRGRGEARFESPIRFEIRAVRVENLFQVEGNVSAQVRLCCSRCLADFPMKLTEAFSLTYCPRSRMPEEQRPGEEAELSPDEIDLIPFDGDQIDLLDGLQEQLVMALPVKPLCSQDCKGICPECGADLNRKPCACAKDRIDPRMAVLAKLKS